MRFDLFVLMAIDRTVKFGMINGLMQVLRPLLYFALLLTSTTALIARPHLIEAIRDGQLDPMWILALPVLFGLFFFAYVVDEIRRSQQPTRQGKFAFASVIFGLVLMSFLFPTSFREYQARRAPNITTQAFFDELLRSPDARIRTLVMMASPNSPNWAQLLERGLSDADPMVQEAAMHAISQKLGIQFPDNNAGLNLAKNTLADWGASR